jgi:hypothetical protein
MQLGLNRLIKHTSVWACRLGVKGCTARLFRNAKERCGMCALSSNICSRHRIQYMHGLGRPRRSPSPGSTTLSTSSAAPTQKTPLSPLAAHRHAIAYSAIIPNHILHLSSDTHPALTWSGSLVVHTLILLSFMGALSPKSPELCLVSLSNVTADGDVPRRSSYGAALRLRQAVGPGVSCVP